MSTREKVGAMIAASFATLLTVAPPENITTQEKALLWSLLGAACVGYAVFKVRERGYCMSIAASMLLGAVLGALIGLAVSRYFPAEHTTTSEQPAFPPANEIATASDTPEWASKVHRGPARDANELLESEYVQNPPAKRLELTLDAGLKSPGYYKIKHRRSGGRDEIVVTFDGEKGEVAYLLDKENFKPFWIHMAIRDKLFVIAIENAALDIVEIRVFQRNLPPSPNSSKTTTNND